MKNTIEIEINVDNASHFDVLKKIVNLIALGYILSDATFVENWRAFLEYEKKNGRKV